MAGAAQFFSTEQKKDIRQAIEKAERETTGEIRVHIDESCKGDVLEQAARIFHRLRMHKTARRNAVLFYLAVKDRKFAIYGDEGINRAVAAGAWDDIRDHMQEKFSMQQFTEGLCGGIAMAGRLLSAHFPFTRRDRNELSNEVTFD